MRFSQDHAHRVAGDQQFFIGGNGVGQQLRVIGADEPFLGRRSARSSLASIFRPAHSIPSQMRARISGEFSPMPPVKTTASAPPMQRDTRRYICARDSRRPQPPGRTRRSSCSFSSASKLAHVVGQAGNSQQARLRIQQRLHLRRRHAFLVGDEVHDRRVEIAGARAHHQSFERRHPHRGIDRLACLRIAAAEQPFPR